MMGVVNDCWMCTVRDCVLAMGCRIRDIETIKRKSARDRLLPQFNGSACTSVSFFLLFQTLLLGVTWPLR